MENTLLTAPGSDGQLLLAAAFMLVDAGLLGGLVLAWVVHFLTCDAARETRVAYKAQGKRACQEGLTRRRLPYHPAGAKSNAPQTPARGTDWPVSVADLPPSCVRLVPGGYLLGSVGVPFPLDRACSKPWWSKRGTFSPPKGYPVGSTGGKYQTELTRSTERHVAS